MHECPNCGRACDCLDDDLWVWDDNEAIECRCECEELMERTELVLNVLNGMDDEERLELFETVCAMFCVFCGKQHPEGEKCLCWASVSSNLISAGPSNNVARGPSKK